MTQKMIGNWICVQDQLPPQNEPIIVAAWEFEMPVRYIVARMWQSNDPGQTPQWYIDPTQYPNEFSHLKIADEVHYWMPLGINDK